MNVVSFETAKRLREAGFPQSEPGENKQGYFYGEYPNNDMGVVLYGHFECASYEIEVIAYAPTATELISPGWYLYRENEDSGMERWACGSDSEVEHFHDNNPAEAAAMAWLHVNKIDKPCKG